VSESLLNLSEAAKRLRIGESTLRQKLYAGLGPVAIKLPGSDRWRFRPHDLDEYATAGEIRPAASVVPASEPAPKVVAKVKPARAGKRQYEAAE
jgi:Helix-turn-helix domain